jgi:hypothetical protein
MTIPVLDETHWAAGYMSRRRLLKGIPLLGAFAAVYRQGAAAPPEHSHAAAVHNMLLTGAQTPFLSHLPMFDALSSDGRAYTSPHRFQVILEASFKKNGADADRVHVRERETHPGAALYTLHPEPFVLTGLKPGDPTAPAVTSFRGTVFRGHLERGGEPVAALSGIEVKVKRILHFREFDPKDKPEHLE